MLLQELHALGMSTSETERRAADAERELMEWKKVSFMAQHVGDEFDALIISLMKFGFFVELTDLFVEGFVGLSIGRWATTTTSTANASAPSSASTRAAPSIWANECACAWTASINRETSWNFRWQTIADS